MLTTNNPNTHDYLVDKIKVEAEVKEPTENKCKLIEETERQETKQKDIVSRKRRTSQMMRLHCVEKVKKHHRYD
jgi:hypothetical protein